MFLFKRKAKTKTKSQHQSFAQGIYPQEMKSETNGLAIQQFPFAPVMVVPLLQHIGKAAIPVVQEGQEVIRGQLLARADGFVSSPVHAPATGTVKKISLVASVRGMVPGLYLKPYPGSTQELSEGLPCSVDSATADDIIHAIQHNGIVGLGGAAFPTHVKLTIPDDKYVDTLIINGIECEPYLTTDHRVMLEQVDDIFLGIRYLLKATGANRAIIAIEKNKLDAAEKLTNAIPDTLPVTIETLDVKYPQGAEKILIKVLLGREVPSGKHSVDVHVVGVNVATAAEIGRLLPHGRGILERVVTLTGPAIKNKGNYRIPIGTPLRFALETVGVADNISQVYLGGPMMGQAIPNLDIPVTKGSSGVIAFTTRETGSKPFIYPCIHCGNCVDVCPMSLNPSQLGLLAKKQVYDKMVGQYHLLECFECGACAYVCPAHIPLVQYFRMAKAATKSKAA